MKEFINLTNHEISIITPEGIKSIPPSGNIARVSYDIEEVDNVEGITIVKINYGDLVGLPNAEKGKYFIVSSVVKNAVGLTRPDVITPYNLERVNGKPYACKGFRING